MIPQGSWRAPQHIRERLQQLGLVDRLASAARALAQCVRAVPASMAAPG